MTNPYLHDKIERVCRDPVRKLGYDDRIFGTMRSALAAGVVPHIMALGAAAAMRYAGETNMKWIGQGRSTADLLRAVWQLEDPDEQADECVRLVEESEARLQAGELL